MVKQITALALLLALANPYCCCAGLVASESDTASEQTPPSTCCQTAQNNPVDQSNDQDQQGPCQGQCGCHTKQQLTQFDGSIDIKPPADNPLSPALIQPSPCLPALTTPPAKLPRSHWWQPPPKAPKRHTLFCCYRT